MSDVAILVLKIVSMFLVMVVGWFARRRNYLSGETTTALSRITTDFALPALIFYQMLQNVDRQSLRQSWAVPIYGAGIILVGFTVGWLLWRAFADKKQAPTFIYVIGVCNWIYLPLPIVEAMYKSAGVQQLLLNNVGVWIVLWTVGVAILHGGRIDWQSMRNLITNPGLLATLSSITLAVILKKNAADVIDTTSNTLLAMSVNTLLSAMKTLGDVTIPLALVVTGAQLGAIKLRGPRPTRALLGIVLLRLIVVPVVMLAIMYVVQRSPWPMPMTAVMVSILVAAMPVAVSCSVFAERFGQDSSLAAQSILYTTVLSIVTVPILYSITKLVFGH